MNRLGAPSTIRPYAAAVAPTQVAGSLGSPSPSKSRGDFPTPPELVRRVVDAVMPVVAPGQPVRVLDPACGDGRFLVAALEHVVAAGGRPAVHGVDVHGPTVELARRRLADVYGRQRVGLGVTRDDDVVRIEVADALTREWTTDWAEPYDVVLGNPPYLSQMAAATTRGGASRRGGGPYADAAAEFLALAVERAHPDGGRVGLVLPQSILGSRDAGGVRATVERRASMFWSWWSPSKQFDAEVVVCALGFERRAGSDEHRRGNRGGWGDDRASVWSDVITRSLGVPDLPPVSAAGTGGQRAAFTANFRDEYYGMIPAVGDHERGLRLVTSGLIDPGRCWWGERPVRFAKRRFARPRVDLGALDARMQAWAARLSVPKVLIANQTRIVECVIDRDGSTLPGVPVVTARPHPPALFAAGDPLDQLAAVLSSPFASAWAWHRAAGTGLSARTLRLGPGLLAALPWPAGSLDAAADAWRQGSLTDAAAAVHASYGIGAGDGAELTAWWLTGCP